MHRVIVVEGAEIKVAPPTALSFRRDCHDWLRVASVLVCTVDPVLGLYIGTHGKRHQRLDLLEAVCSCFNGSSFRLGMPACAWLLR